MFKNFKKISFCVTLVLYIQFYFISTVFANFNSTETNCNNIYVMDASTGIQIYGKNPNEKIFPASTTKIMTALLTLEYAKSHGGLNSKITFSHNAVYSIPRNSSNIAMNEGDTLTVNDALHGLLLASANEVANALGEYVSGNDNSFVALMNQRAKELGAVNTHFVNTNGLHDENHYTTAHDLALIMNQAIKDPTFVQLISTKNYKIPPTKTQPLERPLNNSNKLILPYSGFYNKDIIGSKTGYTDQSMHVLVSYSKKDDKNLVIVTAHGDKNCDYKDTNNLSTYFLNDFRNLDLLQGKSFSKSLDIVDNENVKIGKASVDISKNISSSKDLPNIVTNKDLTYVVNIPQTLPQNTAKNTKVGTVTVSYKDHEITKYDILTTNVEISNVSTVKNLDILNSTPEQKKDTFALVSSSISKITTIIGKQNTPFIVLIISSILLIIVLISSAMGRTKKKKYYYGRRY